MDDIGEVIDCCDGSAIHVRAWCPDCDCKRQFLMIGIDCGECTDCGEIRTIHLECGNGD